MSYDEVAVVCEQGSEVGGEGMLLKVQPVVLLVAEDELIVLEVERRTAIASAIYRSAALAGELTAEYIILYSLDHEQHTTFNSLFLLVCHIGPAKGVDILLDALLQGVEYRFV